MGKVIDRLLNLDLYFQTVDNIPPYDSYFC